MLHLSQKRFISSKIRIEMYVSIGQDAVGEIRGEIKMMKIAAASLVGLVLSGGSAFAGAFQWMGGATVSFSPNSTGCTGLVNGTAPSGTSGYAVGSNEGNYNYAVGFSAYSRSTADGGSFLFVFDMPITKWYTYQPNGGQQYTYLQSSYNRKFAFKLLANGGITALMPGVSVTSTSSVNNIYFNGNDLNGTFTLHYTASGTNCTMTANIIGFDAGGSIN